MRQKTFDLAIRCLALALFGAGLLAAMRWRTPVGFLLGAAGFGMLLWVGGETWSGQHYRAALRALARLRR